MARKRALKQYSDEDLLQEIARRHADKHFREGMTLSEMELSVEELKGGTGEPSIAVMLSRMKPEKPTAKACPRCGKRVPVKARDRERTVRSLAGPVTFKRNYHYCEKCQYGFYPVDHLLGLSEEGELSSELEKRVLDFAVNDVYGECAARWSLHYREPVSENLFRRVAARVGAQCEAADQGRLQEALKPRADAAEVLAVEVDGSLLPIRGEEPWKEAKVGVTYRHDQKSNAPIPKTQRYVAVVNGLGEFAPVLEEVLEVENIDDVGTPSPPPRGPAPAASTSATPGTGPATWTAANRPPQIDRPPGRRGGQWSQVTIAERATDALDDPAHREPAAV